MENELYNKNRSEQNKATTLKPKKGLFGVSWLPVRSYLTPLIKLLYAIIAAPLFIYMGETIVRQKDLYEWLRADNGDFAFWMTSIAAIIVIEIISLVSTKLSVGVGITGALTILCHGVHYFKLQLRGEPFYPWDIFQIKEATDIVSDIKIEFTNELKLSILYTVLIILGAVIIDIFLRYSTSAKYFFRLGAGVILTVCLYMFVTGVIWNTALMNEHNIQLILFDEKTSYNKGGFFITFMQNMENMMIEAPAEYNEGNIDSITDGYSNTDGKNPNIICIMSEAFVYPDQWKNINFTEEITPNLNSIRDSSLTGMVLTPSYGGGTSISEYEVLTGNCASFLPQGSVPYMQYVTTKTDSYASFLKGLGYSTVAIHPYEADFWCRNKAYPLMGFDKFLSQDDFEDPVRPRYYISDMDLTKKIISEYEAAKDDGPFFAFCVSMQNHASYWGGDYGGNTVTLADGDYSQISDDVLGSIRSYATGAKMADEALGALIDYFENSDEETVIIFFGDHQPHLGQVNLTTLGLTSYDNSEALNAKLNYTTPYIIWNNFGVTDNSTADFSMYQLLPYATEKLGLSRPAYFEYLSDAREVLAGHTPLVALNGDGSPVKEKSAEQEKLASDHWLVQYDAMFGRNYGKLW